ncbi:heavy-metal-associated domain-containing protein [Rurimicrobium arvi]|uniref:HMA domain-containing protein n=1 Tax=Rurimicrobium arvi TaxID=2049916 RepID=A0ABP8MIP8_9BACT
MKKLIIAILLCFGTSGAFAQITTAKLTAAGLTCSMCSKSIYTALSKVKFIASVDADVESSVFTIHFKEGADINPSRIRKAVEDAGFSVAALWMNANIRQTDIPAAQVYLSQGARYNFVPMGSGAQVGEQSFRIIDKGFVTPDEEAEMKRLSTSVTFPEGGYHVKR